MGHNPLSRRETRRLIACLLEAIEDPTNPPTDAEKEELISRAIIWLAEDELEEEKERLLRAKKRYF
jgi:hypothetical protein